jgi:hypothetical protein
LSIFRKTRDAIQHHVEELIIDLKGERS